MNRMPEFSLDDYRQLLQALRGAGYAVRPVREMALPAKGKTVYLRHDVDFHLYRADEMAQIDAEEGCGSTFFVLTSGCYNPFLRENREIIERIAGFGHEVGLHYDLRDYPVEQDAARRQLDYDVSQIERLSGQPVSSVCMHEPSAGHEDYFRDADAYVHPHAARFGDGLVYISDSCRAWRDETLLSLLETEAPERVLLNLHSELWMAPEVEDRVEYLSLVSAAYAAHFADRYFREYMTRIWQTHEAVRLDEQRRTRSSD